RLRTKGRLREPTARTGTHPRRRRSRRRSTRRASARTAGCARNAPRAPRPGSGRSTARCRIRPARTRRRSSTGVPRTCARPYLRQRTRIVSEGWLSGPIVSSPSSAGVCTFTACSLYTPRFPKTSTCVVPVCQRASPRSSLGPASCETSNAIGQLMRISSLWPRTSAIVRVAPSGFESAVAHTWQPRMTWTIARRTVGEAAAPGARTSAANAAGTSRRFTWTASTLDPARGSVGRTDYGAGMPERWTRAMLRYRFAVLGAWLVVLVVGAFAAHALPRHLSNTFNVPNTESDAARSLLERHFAERPDGVFTIVFQARRAALPRLQRQVDAAARRVPTAHATRLRATSGIVYGEIDSTLDLQHAKGYTGALRRALPGAYVTGQPAIQHDLEPVLSHDLLRGEAIALPIALAILVAVLGLSLAVLVPFVFAACTITGTLAIVFLLAHAITMVSYVQNLVELVGLGLAIDYSLLVVHRFREERRVVETDDAIVRTMQTAGRSVLFSGATVAIGLALLLVMPVPFVRSLGIGGFLVPVVSMAAAATLQPVLLSLVGRRRRLPRAAGLGPWARLAAAIMRRPVAFLAVGGTLLVAAAVPAAWLEVTPGSIAALPTGSNSVRGVALLRDRVGSGALTPTEIVVETGVDGGSRTTA